MFGKADKMSIINLQLCDEYVGIGLLSNSRPVASSVSITDFGILVKGHNRQVKNN